MKRQIDVLLGSILVAAPVVLSGPVQSTSLQFAGSRPPAFPESYLISSAPPVPSPAADVFQAMNKLGRVLTGHYVVQRKDSLYTIAQKFGTGADYLRSTNQFSSVYIPVGREIRVHNGQGMLHKVRLVGNRPETLQEIGRRYNVDPVAIARANRLPGAALLSSQWLEADAPVFVPGARLRFNDYLLPVEWTRGRLVSSGFGYRRHPVLRYRKFHSGMDLPKPYGSAVKASRDGVVIFADWRGAYGKLIIIKHPGGMRTWYGHLSDIGVAPGRRVRAGQVIGKVGSTGLSTGPHLHFEVRNRYGKALNPRQYLF